MAPPCPNGSDHRRALSPARFAQCSMLEGNASFEADVVWGIVKTPHPLQLRIGGSLLLDSLYV